MKSLRKLFSRTTHQSLNQPVKTTWQPVNQPVRTKPSPIDIPEILERIFSFTDDFTLRTTAVLVCRQWCYINVNRFPRTVYYSYRMGQEKPELAVLRLTGASRLYCYLTGNDVVRDRYDPSRPNFGDIVNSSQGEYRKQSKKRSRTPAHKLKPTIYTFSPLREMVIDIRSYLGGPFDAFPYPQTLTNIALHIRSSESQHLNLSRILSQCSLLEVIIVEAQHADRLYLLWDEPTVPQGSLALRSLTLNHATIDQDILEYLLTSSPHLKALKLISMASSRLHLPTLFRRIKTLPIDLETFHISIHELPWPRGVQQQVFELYPVTSEWNLWAAHMSPSLLKELEVHTPSLTTLELYWRRKGGRVNDEKSPDEITMASRLLFKFLCDSSHAVHLMTLKAGIFHQDMDLYRRGRYSNRNKQAVDVLPPALQGSPTCSGIWRCRDLRVLHINLRDPIASLKRRQQSRIVYGYISKVVPHLDELEIFYPYYNTPEGSFVSGSQNNYRIPMVLEGGFCLLSRLRHLRRLSVISAEGKTTASCKKVDLNWMVPAGRGDEFKEKKQLEVEFWQQQQLVEEEERFRAQDQEQQDDGHVTGDNGDPLDNELRDQFRSLGLLREVAEMITKIDAGSLVPFPSLTGLSFEHPMLQAPEKVLKEIFSSLTLTSYLPFAAIKNKCIAQEISVGNSDFFDYYSLTRHIRTRWPLTGITDTMTLATYLCAGWKNYSLFETTALREVVQGQLGDRVGPYSSDRLWRCWRMIKDRVEHMSRIHLLMSPKKKPWTLCSHSNRPGGTRSIQRVLCCPSGSTGKIPSKSAQLVV